MKTYNAVQPDAIADDYAYTSCIQQDPNSFAQQILNKEQQILNQGYTYKFTGHIGEIVQASDLILFDEQAFNNYQFVTIDPLTINQVDCETELKKENSLFITHLGVIEDGARTNNISGTSPVSGNNIGAWTFGHLMLNMAGGFANPNSPTQTEIDNVKYFLKEWLESIVREYQFTWRVAEGRDENNLIKFIVTPWLNKAFGGVSPVTVSSIGWKNYWDNNINSTEDIRKILEAAPFRLTAIVNRMDLRGNHAYGVQSDKINAGETRFVFTLIDPVTGSPPFHDDTDNINVGLLDWEGMNVILEYGNIEITACEIRQRARDWVALSAYDLEDTNDLILYKEDLEVLTNKVTDANVVPTIVNPNGSAINQVRTNEKIFAVVPSKNNPGWDAAFWELRQYEIDAAGFLTNAPTTNVPSEDDNFAKNAEFQNLISNDVIDWVYNIAGGNTSNEIRIQHGNYNIPDDLLQPTARLQDELMHYFGLDYWFNTVSNNYLTAFEATADPNQPFNKETRKQLSLNTCMGCHASETKTPFTMIRPLGYGVPARYWDAVPSTSTGPFDERFYGNMNEGQTWDDHLNVPVDNYKPDYYVSSNVNSITIPNVSPFLTGRNYRGSTLEWEDDRFSNQLTDPDNDIQNQDPIADNTLKGLFWVNDPSNEAASNSNQLEQELNNKRDGFNDLERRKNDLCSLANGCCDKFCDDNLLMDALKEATFIPLPTHGH